MVIVMYKNKKGFTLVEVVVALAISGLLFVFIASFISIVSNYKSNAVDLSQAQNLAQQVFLEIEGQLRYAQTVNILSGPPESFNTELNYIFLSGGDIVSVRNGGSAASMSPLKGSGEYSYNINFVNTDFHMLQINLTVKNENKVLYTATSTINIQNLGNLPITGSQRGSVIEYKSPEQEAVTVSYMVINGPISTTDGTPITLVADIYPYNAENKKVAWFVDNPKLARISDNGVLTPLRNGLVTVTAITTDGSDISASKQIIISNMPTLIEELSLRTETGQNTLRINGNTLKISADILPSVAHNKTLVWSVDNTDYATISSDGLLTSGRIANKSVVVTATTTDGSDLTATIEILLLY